VDIRRQKEGVDLAKKKAETNGNCLLSYSSKIKTIPLP
jgi:hypothetical protein